MCRPLCTTKEVKFQKCLGHGVKLYVLEAAWNGNKVVLKTPKPLGTNTAITMTNSLFPSDTKKEDIRMSREEFCHHVSRVRIVIAVILLKSEPEC